MNSIFKETAFDRWLWRLLAVAGVVAWIVLLGWMQGMDERALKKSYTSPVTSKKGVIGFSSPTHMRPKAATPQWFAASFFVSPVLAARWEGASPAGKCSACARSANPSSRLPRLAASGTVFQTALLEHYMSLPEALLRTPSADLVVITENTLTGASRAYLALGAIGDMALAIADKAKGNPSKDENLSINGESLEALLSCVRAQLEFAVSPEQQDSFARAVSLHYPAAVDKSNCKGVRA